MAVVVVEDRSGPDLAGYHVRDAVVVAESRCCIGIERRHGGAGDTGSDAILMAGIRPSGPEASRQSVSVARSRPR